MKKTKPPIYGIREYHIFKRWAGRFYYNGDTSTEDFTTYSINSAYRVMAKMQTANPGVVYRVEEYR